MAALHLDVSFPLFHGGSTAAVTDRLRLRLLHLGGTLVDEGWGSADFAAPYWRAYLNLDDGIEVRARGGPAIQLRAGHLYIIPAWLSWAGRCRGRVRHLNASIELPNLPRDRVTARCNRVLHLGGPGAALPDDWLRLGIELAGADQPGAARIARGYALAYEAIAAAFVQLGKDGDAMLAAPGEALLADTVAWIERNLSDHLAADRLAKVAGCSRAELVRRFRSAYGTSPARWIRQRRIAVAADALRCTDDGIDEIARRCGFSDRSRFSKVFASMFGRGPAAWRKQERARYGQVMGGAPKP